MSHLEQRLAHDLKTLRARVAAQAERVETAVTNALHALQTGNRALAYATVLQDHPINRAMRELDRLCHRFIAVHLPSAGHLRLISAIIRANIEFERIGDYAVTIAREGAHLSRPPEGAIAHEIERAAAESLLIYRQAVRAFIDQNAELARASMGIADQIEHNLENVYDELIGSADRAQIKDLFALFVVFTQIKRIADQSKNLCEEAVFAATGAPKAPKVYRVLFVDEDDGLLAPLAVAIARNNHPESGRYRSAGRHPASHHASLLVDFLHQRGLTLPEPAPAGLDQLSHGELSEQHVVVALQGEPESYLDEVPFHTSLIGWDLVGELGEITPDRIDALYRSLAVHIRDLMELVRGDGAP